MMLLTKEFAEKFAEEWIQAWNNRDLDAIMSHYSDDFTMASPVIRTVVNEPSGKLTGKPLIRDYWEKALARSPQLNFELITILVGAESITLYYKSIRGLAAEVFFFNSDGKVVEACAHYANA